MNYGHILIIQDKPYLYFGGYLLPTEMPILCMLNIFVFKPHPGFLKQKNHEKGVAYLQVIPAILKEM